MRKTKIPAIFLCFFVSFFIFSCASNKEQPIDPEKAVYELAPITRTVRTPGEGVYYCVFVRAFADSDGDGTGDFKGLTARLDYLNDGNDNTVSDLGITGIWLMPIFPSQSYHGYDVDDYYNVNPDYGTMEDFEIFLAEAEKRGISVIIDMTCNHSSVYTDWFIASKDPSSPYRNWYRWADEGDPRYNLNQRIWGHPLWNKVGNSYYSGLFVPSMPDFNLANPEVREEFKKISKFWMDKGVDGFRFDAAGHVFNAAKIPAGESSEQQAVAWWTELVGYIKTENPEAYTVGEVWEPPSTRAVYMRGLDSSFHFDLGTKIIDAIRSGDGGQNNLANAMYAVYERYAEENPNYTDAPFLTNHDQNRISGMLRGDVAQLKLAASLYILTEGVPFIYYGEEIGMMGAKPDEQIRTPMMWKAAGKDSLQTTWIDSKYNKNTIPVDQQEKNKDSLLNYYKRVIRIKTAHPALYEGRMTPLATERSEIISWVMESETEKAFVMHNLSPEAVVVDLPEGIDMSLIFTTYPDIAVDGSAVTMPPRGSAVFAAYK
ncbi:alpha-amylase [Brucepastera parasyntrophica]|uniref:alpha-amylase family glycosyl hydrolase n=1 Tax=Brucepastera parasyntrophica TaxID=2880008 RepID=UPI00210C1C09|nr:alpha-amylase family glycosyl hydrolase [Brucepastera parasyntrophica]ULQ60947.1 alpha-amylase [Brucepastera parasyntrophica]